MLLKTIEQQERRNMIKKIRRVIIVLTTACIMTVGCAAEQTKPAPDPEQIEIETPEPCHYGFVMIRTPEGNETMYSTNIDIQRDGKDGKSIYIVVDVINNTWSGELQ